MIKLEKGIKCNNKIKKHKVIQAKGRDLGSNETSNLFIKIKI